jgi:hypothetical protein
VTNFVTKQTFNASSLPWPLSFTLPNRESQAEIRQLLMPIMLALSFSWPPIHWP